VLTFGASAEWVEHRLRRYIFLMSILFNQISLSPKVHSLNS